MPTLIRDLAATPTRSHLSPFVEPVAPALGHAFDADRDVHDERSARELHDATVALVDRLKCDALPPERVIVALKAAIVKYGSSHRMPSLIDDAEEGRGEHGTEAYRKVFAWYLDAYFGTTPSR